MKKARISAGIVLALFLANMTAALMSAKAGATVFHVDDDYDETTPGWGITHFNDIRWALAEAGGWPRPRTIIVHEGCYDGFVEHIGESTVKAAPGEKPVINGEGVTECFGRPLGQVVGIVVDDSDTTVQGFTIKGEYSVGIWVLDKEVTEGYLLLDNKILDNTIDQTGFDPGALPAATGDGAAIQAEGDATLIRNNRVKFGPSSRPHNGISVFYESYRILDNTVTIFEGPKYQVGINIRGRATVANNRVVCPDKTVGIWTKVFGIWVYGLDSKSPATLSATVEKNEVHKTDYAVWLSGTTTLSGTIVKGNTLVNNGIGIIHESGRGTPGDWAGITLEDNRIKNFWWRDYYPAYPPP